MNNIVSLDDLFHKRVFRVPDYQRGYSWENQQVQEFLEDLELLGPDRSHYTGTVVLHKSDSEPRMDEDGNSYVPVDIVDGQQRLTTIVLLLDRIRKSLTKSSKKSRKLSNGIKKNFISTKERNGQDLFKISLNEDTDHFFRRSILSNKSGVGVEGPQISSEKRLAMAKRQIDYYLASKIDTMDSGGQKWLQDLYQKIATQLRFTLYQVGDEAEVGVIFEVMNDRGKPLTELEKVKNYLLHTSTYIHTSGDSNELARSVNRAWAEILRQLMAAGLASSADEDQLLRVDWLTRYDPQSREWKGSRSVKERFALRDYKERHKDLQESLYNYTEGLRESCISFCDAYYPTGSGAFESFKTSPRVREQVIEWSEKLVRIGVVVTFLPLLLAVRMRWSDDPNKYLEILKLCEAFAFRVYRLRGPGSRSDAGQVKLFSLGYELARKGRSFSETMHSIKSQLASWCGDDAFKEFISPENSADWYDPRYRSKLHYFLYEYEITLASRQGASPDVTWKAFRSRDLKNTIEHILPQSIDGQPYWQNRFSRKKHERYRHDLGNLTLTRHNSYYGNRPFPDKKGSARTKGHCYAKSPLYLERDLARWKHWNTSAIEKRRSELLEWARERWAVDLSDLEGGEREPEEAEDEFDENIEVFVDDDDGY